TQFVDLLWPLFLLLNLEHVLIEVGNTAVTPLNFYDYPITHSLVGALAWSLLFGGVYFVLRKDPRASWVVGLGVLSHWVLDFITHRPDLPLGLGSETYFGLGLWNSLPATLVVELGLFVVGIALYIRNTKAKDKIGSYGFWALTAFLVVIYIGNLFGPPPPSEEMIAVAGNAMWLFVLWGYWVDKHRASIEKDALSSIEWHG
ncbi:MAG TPA: hypothetical protein VNL36_10790, partial [Bacteroidota bacterium]|nr:hypothetical protein [Bacteroidota bacterium]